MLLHPPAPAPIITLERDFCTSCKHQRWEELDKLQQHRVFISLLLQPSTTFIRKKLSPKHFVAVLFIITEYLKLQTKQKPPPIDVNAIGLMARLTRPPLEVLVTRRQPMPLVGGGLLGTPHFFLFLIFSNLTVVAIPIS